MPKQETGRGAIVCGTDLSDCAAQAANVAAALAVALKQPLHLVHVVPDGTGRATAGRRVALLNAAGESLHREASRLRQRGLSISEDLCTGRIDEAMLDRARKTGARLIVVGSLGHRTDGRWQLGSTAERTAESAPVPTLVVRSDAPFLTWLRGDRPLRILAGFDFTVTAEAALEWIAELPEAGRCSVTVAYTAGVPDGRGTQPGTIGAANGPALQRALERDVRERSTTLLGAAGAGLDVRVQPRRGRADTVLIDLARETGADLVVTGTHQRHGISRLWHASTSRGVLWDAPMSVACVPVTAIARPVPPVPVIRRVLVTTDFSHPSNRAVAHACALTPPGGTIRLVHVAHPRALAGGTFETGVRTTARHTRYIAGLQRQLLELVPPEAESLGVTFETSVVQSEDVAKGIGEEAERYGADLIAIASRGLAGPARLALGSVAQAVMKRSRRPVLVIRWPED